MESMEAELQEMLEIGLYLGSGPRYLFYYYGQLAITNDAGLNRWPQGPKVIVAVIKAQECACGLSPARKAYLLAKLRSLEDVRKKTTPPRGRGTTPAQFAKELRCQRRMSLCRYESFRSR